MVYCLNDQGGISQALTGNKCASGTGEFFLQQIGRMNLSIDEAINTAREQVPHKVSGRCSVFCKSDCTHALNKGIRKGEVVAGLSRMIAGKVIEMLAKQDAENIIVIGGMSRNDSVIKFIRERYPKVHVPREATYFEALGAALIGLDRKSELDPADVFQTASNSFSFLPALDSSSKKVKFNQLTCGIAVAGDECIIGLDVGSTTTKAVILRTADNALLASVYLRTNGNPVQASVECYRELRTQIREPIRIIGLGTTGSGRQIAGLHALTEGVVNEIIAHAVAAAYFDPEVDTIFEIGGQDAKYTYLTNGIASDYAMNEACSAGTGSFLEEAANESLGINYLDIGEIAFQAESPPNFNDQCAAFISSDIKNAIHDGIPKVDIVAGLVYSICMNYVNRVKGNRPVGRKVFMQGGVCYNRAVPVAMSELLNKEIVVPPEPGLMGAFGVALEIKKRLDLGLLKTQQFSLDELIDRVFHHLKDFTCAGGGEKCDLKCKIALLEVDGKKYPFGGACNKYYNHRRKIKTNSLKFDHVRRRQDIVFDKAYNSLADTKAESIGMSRSFLTNTFYPLFASFFSNLGYKVILPDEVDSRGVDKIRSSFCYPVEVAHGLFQNLIDKKPDHIFLPHIVEIENPNENDYKKLCVFVQGEPYYLKSAFSGTEMPPLLTQVFNFTKQRQETREDFVKLGKMLGRRSSDAKAAFERAMTNQEAIYGKFRELGRNALDEIESDPDIFGIVLFGRSYNAFAAEANVGIPHKIASKGMHIIPHDFLDSAHLPSWDHMYWYSGQQILRSARFVKNHEQLFGLFVTNFSCGPDSFIIQHFRRIMGSKPSLTLELDSHSADVGVNTRIDAAIDIIKNYIELSRRKTISAKKSTAKPLNCFAVNEQFRIVDSSANRFTLQSPEVKLVIPSMGHYSAEAFAANARSQGINAHCLPIPTAKTLKYGRSHTTCKECLPFILTAGSMVEYIRENGNNNGKVLFFMPTSSGPCRFGQYANGLKELIKELDFEDVGVLSLTDENSYAGLGSDFFLKAWLVMVIADYMPDIENAILAAATDPDSGLEILDSEWKKMLEKIEGGDKTQMFNQLEIFAERMSNIPLKYPLEEAKIVTLTGEIYVRREEFSRMDLIKTLIDNGFVIRTTPITEFVYYCNYATSNNLSGKSPFKAKLKTSIKNFYQKRLERQVISILAKSGLIKTGMIEIEKTISHSRHLISEQLTGEGILTTGLALREILDESCGVITIGPFACMPSRLAEAILNTEMTLEGKFRCNNNQAVYDLPEITSLPYMHFETDGNPFPQIMQSKLEIFMLQAEKLHKALQKQKTS